MVGVPTGPSHRLHTGHCTGTGREAGRGTGREAGRGWEKERQESEDGNMGEREM